MLYNAVEVAAIRLAASGVENLGIYSKEILLKSVIWLRENYEIFGREAYLEKAVWNIYAYLELGFPFEDSEEEFYKVLEYLHKDVEEVFPAPKWRYKKIPLNKTNVRDLMGKWNPVLHSMKISDAVSDIIAKVSDRAEGEYLYFCGKVLEQDGEKVLWEHTFKLYVRESEAILYNVNKNKYYVFV